MTPITHNFDASLKQSMDDANDPFWHRAYNVLWPNQIVRLEKVLDIGRQKRQVDRIVHLKDGSNVLFEEKMRHKHYGADVLVEYWSSKEDDTPGWAVKEGTLAEYLIYAVPERNFVYVAKFAVFQRAVRDLQYDFSDAHYKKVRNIGTGGRYYHTWSVPIPFSTLHRKCGMAKHSVPSELASQGLLLTTA